MNKEKKNIPYILKNGPTHIENKRPISQVMKGRQTKLKCNTVYVLHPKKFIFFPNGYTCSVYKDAREREIFDVGELSIDTDLLRRT